MNGELRIALVKNPDGWDPKLGDRNLNLELTPEEWESLFLDVLDIPNWDEKIETENAQSYFQRQRQNFEQALSAKGYPMLGRIWDIYRNAAYLSSEVDMLKEECFKVRASTDNAAALKGLEKLLLACEQAKKANSGIHLLSD